MRSMILLCLATIFFAACKPEVYTPKPRGYFNIELPTEHTYQNFDSASFPYHFEYPTYGEIVTDPTFFGDKPENPYWLNLHFPGIGGKIYISYKPVNGIGALAQINEDFYQMTYTVHDKKADYIQDFHFNDYNRKVFAALYNVAGDAASAYQFYATDSQKHYIRGALYFETTPNADSLKPLNEFLKQDIVHILETLNWSN